MENIINLAEDNLIHTYNRFAVVFERGDGVYLYDTNGKKYLDFYAGIAVNALGYGYPEYSRRLKEQVDQLLHTSNYFYTKPLAEAAKKLAQASGMERVFFCNSGTEAVEGALKLARRYTYSKGQKERNEIISMNHSFHGRSMGAVSVTGTPSYREPFEPLIGGVKFATFNDLESVKALVSEKTCAIILEVVQGEGGLNCATKEFLSGLRSICDERDIVLIFDEVQCGMGRTGTMFAYQDYDLLPDVIMSAKGLGNGVPVGAFAVVEKMATALLPGDHGTTYGGNPLATTAVNAVFDIFESDHILQQVQEVSAYLESKLDELVKTKEKIVERRGKGLMQGLVFNEPVTPYLVEALEKGLVLISAGSNIIRMVPPLIITKQQVDEMILILESVI